MLWPKRAQKPAPEFPSGEKSTTEDSAHKQSLSSCTSIKNGCVAVSRCYERYLTLITDTWFAEIISWLFSLACFLVTLAILFRYDGQPLPKFSYGITVGTLVATSTTLSATALMVPVSNGMSQLKWLRFTGRSRKAIDFELYDQASRGVWGSLVLLASPAPGWISAAGALVTILVLASNAITQQALDYVPSNIIDHHVHPTIPYSRAFTATAATLVEAGTDPSFQAIDAQSQGAILNGIFIGNSTIRALPLQCPTGNCTWPIYRTLAVCSSVSDVSDLVTKTDDFTFQLDGVGQINKPGKILSFVPGSKMVKFFIRSTGNFVNVLSPLEHLTSPSPYTISGQDVQSKRFNHLKNTTLADFFVLWAVLKTIGTENSTIHFREEFHAVEVNLHFCVKKLHSKVQDGNSLTKEQRDERITEFKYQDDLRFVRKYQQIAAQQAGFMPLSASMVVNSIDPNQHFRVTSDTLQALQLYTRSIFNGTWDGMMTGQEADQQSNERIFTYGWPKKTNTATAVAVIPISKILMQWERPKEGLRDMAGKIATAFSVRMLELPSKHDRPLQLIGGSTGTVDGTAHRTMTFVQVLWGWMALLAMLVAASLVFLFAVIVATGSTDIGPWKACNLATLQALDVYGPQPLNGMQFSVRSMERTADTVDLRLQRIGKTWRLVVP